MNEGLNDESITPPTTPATELGQYEKVNYGATAPTIAESMSITPELGTAFSLPEVAEPTGKDLENAYRVMDERGCVTTPRGSFPYSDVVQSPERFGFVSRSIDAGLRENGEIASAPSDPEMARLHGALAQAETILEKELGQDSRAVDYQYRIPDVRNTIARLQHGIDSRRLEQQLDTHPQESHERVIEDFIREQKREHAIRDVREQIRWTQKSINEYRASVTRNISARDRLEKELASYEGDSRGRGDIENELERVISRGNELEEKAKYYEEQAHAISKRQEELLGLEKADRSTFAVPSALEEDPDYKACLEMARSSKSDDDLLYKQRLGLDPHKEAVKIFKGRFPEKARYYAQKEKATETVFTMREEDRVGGEWHDVSMSTETLQTDSPDADTFGEELHTQEKGAVVRVQDETSTVSDFEHTPEQAQPVFVDDMQGRVSEAGDGEKIISTPEASLPTSNAVDDEEYRIPEDAETDATIASRETSGGRLLEYVTGLSLENPDVVVERLTQDQKIIRAKYGLPERTMRFDAPVEYERILRARAKEYGIAIRSPMEFGSYFEEHGYAGGLHDSATKRIGIGLGKDTLDDYQRWLGILEHEIIHAGQNKHFPGMPIELMEYEAYVAGSAFGHLREESPEEMRDSLETFFDLLIGGSVRHWYDEMSKERKTYIGPK